MVEAPSTAEALALPEPAAPGVAASPLALPSPETAGRAAAVPAFRPARARHRLALAAILLFHVALAVWMAAIRGPYDPYFYDENFNMENVAKLVATHEIAPANGWYSMVSYLVPALAGLAMDELHQRTGKPWLRAIDRSVPPPHPATYNLFLAARLIGIGYGCLSLWLVFSLGVRLFSPATGVLAAAALAVSPWTIRSSVEFKPDSLLLLTTLLAVLLLFRFLEAPSQRRFLWAAGGLGLATGAKLNGVFLAPLVAVACVGGALAVPPRGLRPALGRIARWGAAGAAVAAAVFLTCAPYLRVLLAYIDRNVRIYEQKAGASTGDDLLRQTLADLQTPVFFGPYIAALALAGAALVLAGLFDRRTSAALRLSRLLLVLFPLLYAVQMAFLLGYYKHNNLVLLLPFPALLAAAALTTLGGITERWPRWLGRGVAFLATVAFLAHCAWLALSFSHEENVPHTWQVASRRLGERPAWPRVVIYEGPYETIPDYRGRRADDTLALPSVRWVDDAAQLERERLDLADVLVLRQDLRGPQRSSWLSGLAAELPPEALVEIEPWPLVARGPGYLLLFHEWRRRDLPPAAPSCAATDDPALFRCRLPKDFAAGEVASLHFVFGSKKLGVAEIRVGASGVSLEEEGESLETLASADLGAGKGWEAMSERFVVPSPGAPFLLRFEKPVEPPLAESVPLTASRWDPPPLRAD